MFSIFTLAIKFDCLFLTIYQRFHLFVDLIFDKLAPPPLDMCFKRCFKSLFSPLQCIKQSQSAKNVVFFPFCFLVDMSMGGYSPPAPPWLRYWPYRCFLNHPGTAKCSKSYTLCVFENLQGKTILTHTLSA